MLQSKHGAGSRHPLTAGIDQAVGVAGMGVQVLPAAASHGSCVAWCCCHERCSAPTWPCGHLHRFPSTSYAHPREGLVRPDALGPAVPPLRSGRLLHRCCSVWKSAGSIPSSLTGLSPTFVPFQGQGREEVVWKIVTLPFSTNLPGLINQPGIRTICTFYLFQIRMERAFSYCFGSIDHPLTRTVSTGEECIRPSYERRGSERDEALTPLSKSSASSSGSDTHLKNETK